MSTSVYEMCMCCSQMQDGPCLSVCVHARVFACAEYEGRGRGERRKGN